MRITIVMGPFLPMPPAPCGAVEMVWHGLAEQFVRQGHTVTVLCRAGDGQGEDETIAGVRYIRRPSYTSGRWIYPNIVKDLLYSARMFRLLPEADILVTNVFWLPILAAWWKHSAGKVVMNIQRVPKGQMWLYKRVPRLAAVSSAIRDSIVRECPSLASQVRVIPNPVELGVFSPPEGGRAFTPRPGEQRTIVYTGRVHPEKGLHVLVDAFSRLHDRHPDLRLRIIGPWRVEKGGGGEEYVRRLKDAAANRPVVFDEPIYERRALAAALREGSYYCYPTLAEQGEAQPVAPMEAMATGMAPVVSAIPQFSDYLTNGENGFVFDHRADQPAVALAEALARLIDDPQAAARMGRRAAEGALSFGYPAVASMYLRDFQSLASPAGSLHGSGVASTGATPRERIRTMRQADRYSSAWPTTIKLKVMLWHLVWLTVFRTTPKPLNAWRLFLLRLFGAHITGSPYVASSVMIRMPWHLTLGMHCAVNYGVDLYTLGRIILHPRCTVSQEAYLCTGTHDLSDPVYPLQVGDIEIGEEAFVGVRALIMPGVVVGEGAVVGGGAVVTRDVPPWTIVAGNPAKPIKTRVFPGKQTPDAPAPAPPTDPRPAPAPPAAVR